MTRGPSLLTLLAGDLAVDLAPEIGGSVASFRMRRPDGFINLMRSMPEKAQTDRNAGGASMFPMVPFANRIIGNRFDFKGRTYQLQPNVLGEPFAIHGSGWQSKWNVHSANETPASCVLNISLPTGLILIPLSNAFTCIPIVLR